MSNPEEARLVVENAEVRYGELKVLANVSLNVGNSEVVSIVGPSGCGKTTLLRCIAGLTLLAVILVSVGELIEKRLVRWQHTAVG